MDENDDAIDLTLATIVYELRDPATKSTVLSADISIDTTTFTASLTATQMRGLCAKDYDVGCTIELGGVVSQFFVGTLPVVDGVVA